MKQKTILIGIFVLLLLVLAFLVVSQLKDRSVMSGRTTNTFKGAGSADQQPASQPTGVTVAVSPSPAIGAVNAPSSPVTVTVSSPQNGTTVSASSVLVKGKTVPKAEVYVNDSSTVADATGAFSVQLSLDEGENPIIVVANDADGNMAEAELTITYDSGK